MKRILNMLFLLIFLTGCVSPNVQTTTTYSPTKPIIQTLTSPSIKKPIPTLVADFTETKHEFVETQFNFDDYYFIFIGDSLTGGKTASRWYYQYPNQTMQRLHSPYFITVALTGAGIFDLSSAVTKNVDSLITPDRKFVLLVWIGANNINSPFNEFTKELTKYWQDRKTAGFSVIAFTVLPQGIHHNEGRRVRMNKWIRENWNLYCDGLVDVDASSELQDPLNTVYYKKDTIHLTDAGYAIVSQLTADEILRTYE